VEDRIFFALLINQLGYKNQATRFLHGVFFTHSFLQKTVPELQTLFMADACHLNFGKYTMFTCYGITLVLAVGHFFCAWHRRKNIIKQCGGSRGPVPYSALWVYNKLMKCWSVVHLDKLRDWYFPLMYTSRDLQYLNNIVDHAQYPVKRCKQEGAYMYHRQTSQGSEVMNVANINLPAPTAVCPVNAVMLTIKTECHCFKTQQTSA